MMKYFTWIAAGLLFLTSCTQDLAEMPNANSPQGEGVRLAFSAESMELIETRAGDDAPVLETSAEADSRIEHVIIYAFRPDGTFLTRYQQELEYPDKEVRMVLPQEEENIVLHAVCNYEQMWEETEGITNADDLKNKIVTISQPDGAFNGSMIMHGTLEMSQQDIQDKSRINTIWVRRIAARIDFSLKFDPINDEDEFYLSSIQVCRIPNQSYLIKRDKTNTEIQDASDAAYNSDVQTALENNYFANMLLQPDGNDETGYDATFYLFENRCGEVTDTRYEDKYSDNEDLYQTMKGTAGEEKGRQLSTYIQINGTYVTHTGNKQVTKQATYAIYLGKDNYKDFNVTRNCKYTVTATINTCNDIDTRVTAYKLEEPSITISFNNPLDAHCNSMRCFGFTYNQEGWELYVEEPDKHPWLEISFSPQYRPHIAGHTYEGVSDNEIASTRFTGEGAFTGYFYIHTDEYIPANGNADESWNNTTDENAWRTGYIVLYDKKLKKSYRQIVQQRPAQVVKMPIKNLLGQTTGYNEYYVEYELEQKNLTWGFLKYGANPVMTGMINDRWDGLSNTRKLYQEAIKAGDVTEAVEDADGKIYRGAYNGYYTIEDDYPWQKDDVAAVINQIPDDHMIKYVLSKNRDRNGNGYIDYDEIVWYVPALDELAELRRVLDAGHMAFQNSEDRFHSSTPYLAGYTDEVPGRAFYVKMGDGETAFAMRDRQYNVICCRRKGAWLGNPDAGYEGGVTVDDTWDEEGEENIIMPKGN